MKFTYIIPSSAIRAALVFVLCGWSLAAFAQPSNNSPYARYGLGNMNYGVNVRTAGTGLTGIALREDSLSLLINFVNPASYTSLGLTSFDIGVYGNVATISSSTSSQNVNKANLSYFAFGFPVYSIRVKNKADTVVKYDENDQVIRNINRRVVWGGAFGLREFSSINYSVNDIHNDTTGAFGTTDDFGYEYKFQGDGGLNQFFIGMGLSPFKNFSIGINASYLFGRMNRIQRLEFYDDYYFNVKKEEFTDVGGFYVDYGLQYTLPVKNRGHLLTFGATFAHPMKVRANSTTLARTYTLTSYGEDIPRDTMLYRVIKGGNISMPWKYGFGLNWRIGNKWTIGAEHNQELWSTYRDVNGKNDSLTDAWRTSAGIEFTPSVPETNRGFWAYFGKMYYRLGGHYAMTQYKINGVQLPDYGITLGLGFPLRKERTLKQHRPFMQSMINIAVEWGQRGTTNKNLLLENYWNFKIGFTLNGDWFNKYKYQ